MFEAEDVRALVDIGFIALSRGLGAHAEAIFEGVSVLRPAQEAGFVGRALVALFRGDCTTAVDLLRRAPPTDSARLFLGMALGRSGDATEAKRILEELERSAAAPSIVDLARSLRAEMENRAPDPFAR